MPPPPTATRVSRFLTKNKKHGWTLAETLITLTIIGVIAALTVPNLMSNFRKREIETALPIAYKLIDDAMNLATISSPSRNITQMIETSFALAPDYVAVHNYFAENYLVPYLKVTKTCKSGVAKANCDILSSIKFIDGTALPNARWVNANEKYRIQLQNGMQIGVGFAATTFTSKNIGFMVDINGNKAPNKFGYDVFFFTISAEACTHPNPYYCAKHNFLCPHPIGTSNYALDSTNGVPICGSPNGSMCAARIYLNGWKIPDDYPIKKF